MGEGWGEAERPDDQSRESGGNGPTREDRVIELVLVFCMVADPGNCLEQRPTFEEPLTAASCLMNAQQMAVEYVREHPTWQLKGWRCEKDKPAELPA